MGVEEKKQQIRDGLTKVNRHHLYAVSHYLPGKTAERIGMVVPCAIYAQDPFVAGRDDRFAPKEIHLRWEPGLAAGPTSSRLAVVDYDADHDLLVPPARWDQERFCFLRPDGEPVGPGCAADDPWFRQLNAWATVQGVLEYFESPRRLGRAVPWGFAGNRLMLVPNAGHQQNAYYNRDAKALQLYYYGDRDAPSYTSLSHDVLAHEAGHAVLDGVRPLYLEHSSRDTAAFHEAMGDLTALLVAFRHNHEDAYDSEAATIDPERLDSWVANLAEEFGQVNDDRPYLRTAVNRLRLDGLAPGDGHHHASQVLTGAMFDVLARLAAQYLSPQRQAERKKKATVRNALWWAADRIGRLVFQPLDLLPPADVGFLDYARAVLHHLSIADPVDRWDYQGLIRRVFHERGFCPNAYDKCERDPATCTLGPLEPPRPDVYHDVGRISRSPTDAYRFLHDNRRVFHIPPERDFEVVDLYEADKYGREVDRLPRQVVVEYLWREEVELAGADFGALDGRTTTLPCGGTVVLDSDGNLLSWCHKPGRESEDGRRRRDALVEHVARLQRSRRLGLLDDPAVGALGVRAAPVLARSVDGALRLHTAPHLCNRYAEDEEEPWTTSF